MAEYKSNSKLYLKNSIRVVKGLGSVAIYDLENNSITLTNDLGGKIIKKMGKLLYGGSEKMRKPNLIGLFGFRQSVM